MKTGLVLEGGALRTIFSAGVCDAFLDGGLPLPDYTVGVSAGSAYGVSYLSRQSRRHHQLIAHYAGDRRYMGWRNLANPRNRSYFGLEFGFSTIPNELVPFDYDTIADSVKKTGRLVVVHEAHQTNGWGAQVVSQVGQMVYVDLTEPYSVVLYHEETGGGFLESLEEIIGSVLSYF